MIERALELIRYGWPVIPLHGVIRDRQGKLWCSCSKPTQCRSPAKHPRTPQGLKNASTDANWIEAWWSKWPDANIGIVTGARSGLVVLDVDIKNFGEHTLDALVCKHGKLPETAEVLTGGGGRHLYFKYPGIALRNSAGHVGQGLDIRADGGYVVGSGSVHISGRTYDWEASSCPEQVGIAPLPIWLVELCSQRPTVAIHVCSHVVEQGRRNQWLTSVGGYLRRRGVDEHAIARALWCINSEHCSPPLGKEEVLRIAASVARYAVIEEVSGLERLSATDFRSRSFDR